MNTLKIRQQVDLTTPYMYFVVTPEGDHMYFETKEKARHFISVYNDTKNKRDNNVKQDRRPTMGR